jgi:hypothetical protein
MIDYITKISNELEKVDNLMLQAEMDYESRKDKEKISQKKNAIHLMHSLILQRLDISLL